MQGMNIARGGTLHQHLPDHRQTHAPWAAGFLKRYRDETVFLFPPPLVHRVLIAEPARGDRRRITPGETPVTRLNARLNAASER
jgi:hypothetical protein